MTRGKNISIVLLVLLFFSACQEDVIDKYERPEWLDGKVFTQIQKYDDLSTFTQCLEITGYDTVINVSGSYTVFAPTNEAFDNYFAENPQYSSIEDIPYKELSAIVRYHILQNPWSKNQLRSLDIYGWIDEDDEYNNKPRGFKRETLLLTGDKSYGVKENPDDVDKLIIVDSLESAWHRRVITDSRKFAPLFYQEYFSIYNLNLSDFTFYFDRTFDTADDLYYIDAKVSDEDIFAENGFVYKIDKVVTPLRNANEILSSNQSNNNYSKFLDLVNQFPQFSYNVDKTFEQAGAEQGLQVDSLFDLSYPDLTFNICNEKTKAPAGVTSSSNNTIRFHHGLMAPTNEAFDAFVQQYITGNNQWGSMENLPENVKRIIANSYFSINPIYETDINEGFYNGELDIVRLNTGDIVEKEFGSNCTFIGLNKPLVPRALKGVTGPIYRQRGYYTVMNAIEYTGLLSALKKDDQDLTLFTIDDLTLRQDSSLFYEEIKRDNVTLKNFRAIMLAPSGKSFYLNQTDLRILLLNHVAIESPKGIASKEYLQTLAGNHLVWDNENNSIAGTSESTFGFNGSQPIVNYPRQISTDADNGVTYEIDSWFNFKTNEIYTLITSQFPEFHALLSKAGYALDKEYRYSFLSNNKYYTMFLPSAEALAEISADTLTGANLQNFVKLHFIQDELIFTDGKVPAAYFKTSSSRIIEGTNQSKDYELYIEPGIDYINVMGADGNTYTTINLSDSSNLITARAIDTGTETQFPNIMTSGVAHKIDKAFVFDLLDIR